SSCCSHPVARSVSLLFMVFGSLLDLAVLVLWLARDTCCSDHMARLRYLLFLSYDSFAMDVVLMACSIAMLFRFFGSLSFFAVLRCGLALIHCCSYPMARSLLLLFTLFGSLSYLAVPAS
ncbi:MAG: hypothetical protein ACR2RB_22440, partial [Gammaproteobacteria bacterium]